MSFEDCKNTTCTFSYYSKTTPNRENDWIRKGTYIIDDDGIVTLMYENGEVKKYRYEVGLSYGIPVEVLLSIDYYDKVIPPRKIDFDTFVRQ